MENAHKISNKYNNIFFYDVGKDDFCIYPKFDKILIEKIEDFMGGISIRDNITIINITTPLHKSSRYECNMIVDVSIYDKIHDCLVANAFTAFDNGICLHLIDNIGSLVSVPLQTYHPRCENIKKLIDIFNSMFDKNINELTDEEYLFIVISLNSMKT